MGFFMQSTSHVFPLCLFIVVAACKATSESASPSPTLVTLVPVENDGMHDRNVELAQRAKDNANARLVFLGDSITQGWESVPAIWAHEFAAYSPLNLGVSGDRTEHVLWRLEQGAYDRLRPSLFVIMIGTNNTGHRMDPPADIAAGVQEILAQLKRRYPMARLALLAIFPRGEKPDDPARANNNAVNALLVPIAKQAGAEWLDITRAFVDSNGLLSKTLMPDLLHPNSRGYEVWANAIRDPPNRWMNR